MPEYVIPEYDRYLFHEGTCCEMYRYLGAHLIYENAGSGYGTGKKIARGAGFSVWAPEAAEVCVLTQADHFDADAGRMKKDADGVWHIDLPGVCRGDTYRFKITGKDSIVRYKSDPYAFYSQLRPQHDSVVWDASAYVWHDAEWISRRKTRHVEEEPMAIYEVHLGSWKKDHGEKGPGFMNYRRLADELSQYLDYMGYTHVELMGICEHPFDGSWGYQVTGYFAPTSRYGEPEDLKYFVDVMHDHGIGVILDFVPAHFPRDDWGLERFDGTGLYEPEEAELSDYPEWGTKAFDHRKPEVMSFLISAAAYWVEEYHMDGLRVDAVSSMIFHGSGSREFLKRMNRILKGRTGAYVIAEDSSIEAHMTDPVEKGGYGFTFKWSMGWMNDTLKYFRTDPVFRRLHHNELTAISDYSFNENYILVLSHDEVVHLKAPMLYKNPGNLMDKMGGLKVLYTFQMTFPGKKLLFMGQDVAEDREWNEDGEINWALADEPGHRDVMLCVRRLLKLYRKYPVLHADSKNPVTMEWVNRYDADRNILCYLRRNPWNYDGCVLTVLNMSPVWHRDYTCGIPEAGSWYRIFSSYDGLADGTDPEGTKAPEILSAEYACDGYPHMLRYDLRPYEAAVFTMDL